MTKRYGTKNAERVAAAIVRMILDGDLRSGHRIDRNELASALGLSRAPVQEALVQLERDGLVRIRYHRGAFVERFDAETVREQFLIFGMLSGEAAARAASLRDPQLVRDLRALVEAMRTAGDPEEWDTLGFEFQRLVNRRVAGPRLRALLKSFLTFIPEAFHLLWDRYPRIILPYYEAELLAIENGDPEAARCNAVATASFMAEQVVDDLLARGTLDRPPPGARAGGSPVTAGSPTNPGPGGVPPSG